MQYLTDDQIKTRITESDFAVINKGNALDLAEGIAVDLVKQILNERYDIDAALAAEPINASLLKYLIDILVYEAATQVNSRMVGELRYQNYQQARADLAKWATGRGLTCPLPERSPVARESGSLIWGDTRADLRRPFNKLF